MLLAYRGVLRYLSVSANILLTKPRGLIMFDKLAKRVQNDSGDSTLVSTVIVLPLLIVIFFTIIDVSIYFSNNSLLNGVARDGARTVAIMGGTDSPLSDRYGVGEVEENLVSTLDNTKGLISVSIDTDTIDCGPDITAGVGEETHCEIPWTYNGVGLSLFSLLASSDDHDFDENALNSNITRGTAESEVGF